MERLACGLTHFDDGARAIASANDIKKIGQRLGTLGLRSGSALETHPTVGPAALAAELQAAIERT